MCLWGLQIDIYFFIRIEFYIYLTEKYVCLKINFPIFSFFFFKGFDLGYVGGCTLHNKE